MLLTDLRGYTVLSEQLSPDELLDHLGRYLETVVAAVRAEGGDTLAMEFDVLDFVRDAKARQLNLPGSQLLSVAVGFEIWNGPVNNLETVDFFVDAK